ncbi:acetyl-CoA carboxylase biotin carboxyl carrier protein [Saccharothrix sp. ST-888]|uniref:acetyl-CoA carboxylase biotin carboxyl carrier protein n=1 Tax=Saccharothrix sp. ST-888 TaxID=1427391 RepID=UPI0018CE8F80|nr:biotin/lipoyl-containing protein [Saccharothrix sp. ST-888]
MDKKTHQENGRQSVTLINPHSFPGGAEASRADLEAVCRAVRELAGASPLPPTRIRLQHGRTTVEIEWPAVEGLALDGAARLLPPSGGQPAAAGPAAGSASGPVTGPAAPAAGTEPETGLRYICASMVGTFYHASEPGSPPFVSVGDLVRPGQTVGVLEVMKMMSTIEAEIGGRVVEVLVPNASSVEYQQRLIAVDPLAEE